MPLPDFPQRLLEIITNAVSVFLLIVLFYILQYIFDMNFVCSCRAGLHPNGVLYMALPPLILTFVVKIMELLNQRRRIFSRWHCLICNCYNSHLCGHLLMFLPTYFSMSAVWISTVLFDGDWYFCLMTNFNDSQTGLPCKANLTAEERHIKDTYKTDSLDYGFAVLCVFIFLWSLVEIGRTYCIQMRPRKISTMYGQYLCPPYYSVVYKTFLAKEVTNCLNSGLKEIAEKKAKAMCDPYLEAIKKHELPNKDTGDGNDITKDAVPETWQKISACDFYLMENKRQENSHGGRDADPPTSPPTGPPASPPASPLTS